MSVGQDIEGHVLFPEDNYRAGEEYQDGPQPEDKVSQEVRLGDICSLRVILKRTAVHGLNPGVKVYDIVRSSECK